MNLTLLLDKGEQEQQRWQRLAEEFRFNDQRAVLEKTPNDPALVVLAAPGCGKSTLLRRFSGCQLKWNSRQQREEKKVRIFAYGSTFDRSRSNTFESHILRTTPVGIFDNANT